MQWARRGFEPGGCECALDRFVDCSASLTAVLLEFALARLIEDVLAKVDSVKGAS